MAIDCDGCNASCCRYIQCTFITDDGKCSIYKSRPDVCNAEYMYKVLHSKTMTREEWEQNMGEICKETKRIVSRGEVGEYVDVRELSKFVTDFK